MEFLVPLLVILVISGFISRKLNLSVKLPGGSLDNWLRQSNFNLFVVPLLTGSMIAMCAYLLGGVADVTRLFGFAFIGFILFNVFYRASGRDTYPLRVSAAFLLVVGGSITSLLLFNLTT